jgi:hypothetical protein
MQAFFAPFTIGKSVTKSIAQRFFAARVTVPAIVTLSAIFLAMATIVPLTSNAKESPTDKPTVVLAAGPTHLSGAAARSSSCTQYKPTHSLGFESAMVACIARTYSSCKSRNLVRSADETANKL